jgi:hypothetical protein
MKLAFALNDKKLSGALTRLFTGCSAYHSFWHDDEFMYDMHLIRRRRAWPHYGQETTIVSFDVPEVTREFLERRLSEDESTYGWKDYMLFALRPLYHLIGKSTRNVGGVICSEMTNNDMVDCGVVTPWAKDGAPPSPCDQLRWRVSMK